jgi:hypothetical protein
MSGPPSYYYKRKDGIPVPTLNLFRRGYKNLTAEDIPSKTLKKQLSHHEQTNLDK